MVNHFKAFVENLKSFTPKERYNIAVYIVGIMIYKFGLEAFNGSVVALATNRYDYETIVDKNAQSRTFERLGLLTGLNQAFQCVGSILIAPLIKHFPTKNVLSGAILFFGLCAAIFLIMDAATGGTFVPKEWVSNHPKNFWPYYGTYSTDGLIPVYSLAGIVYGMVELIRRVIPRDIVGGNVNKLKKMDSIVHICYEITGTAGAFVTGLVIIPQLGNNRAFIITPICFGISAIVWFFIRLEFKPASNEITNKQGNAVVKIFTAIGGGFLMFFESVYYGGYILFSSRKFVWLIPSYAVALYAHRYLENGIAPQVARRYLGESAWSQIMVGGSNLGEMLGALFVFFFTDLIKTPIPWLRLDALMLLVVWYIPYWYPPQRDVTQAWIVAATFLPVSFGWAAGDVSLAAYIQAALHRREGENPRISSLGAVMAFLYSLYITLYAVGGTLLGRYLDSVYNSTGRENGGTIRPGLVYTAGVQFTLIMVLVLTSTFVPRGAFAFNPDMLSDEKLDHDDDVDSDGNPTTEKHQHDPKEEDMVVVP